MTFNINEEYIKLIKVTNDDTFYYKLGATTISFSPQINFLWDVLKLTLKYPQVELYLKDLLNYFTVSEMEKFCRNWTIIHYMSHSAFRISLNAFKIIINYGVNINSVYKETLVHVLLRNNYCDDHINSILNLFIEHGINLNIKNVYTETILDVIICRQNLNEETKNCIMTLVDFGVTVNDVVKNEIYDYIEYYKNSTIKPTIKK